MLWLWKYLYI